MNLLDQMRDMLAQMGFQQARVKADKAYWKIQYEFAMQRIGEMKGELAVKQTKLNRCHALVEEYANDVPVNELAKALEGPE